MKRKSLTNGVLHSPWLCASNGLCHWYMGKATRSDKLASHWMAAGLDVLCKLWMLVAC